MPDEVIAERRRAAPSRNAAALAIAWALAGVAAIFVDAIVQLGRRGIATVRAGLDPAEWFALALMVALFLWGEGIRALQRRWVPHVIGNARRLRDADVIMRVLAPLYVMSLVGAPRRTLVRAWAGVAAIVAAVLIVRALPEPWRGIIDLAVAAALSWGLGTIVALAPRAFDPIDNRTP